jgi:hypothetical protein
VFEMNFAPSSHRKLNVVRKHVLDDLWEIIKAKNLVEPLIASPSLSWVKSDALHASLFLRMQLSRQVILVLTRLNAIPGKARQVRRRASWPCSTRPQRLVSFPTKYERDLSTDYRK